MILSAAPLLRWLGDRHADPEVAAAAELIERAVADTIAAGFGPVTWEGPRAPRASPPPSPTGVGGAAVTAALAPDAPLVLRPAEIEPFDRGTGALHPALCRQVERRSEQGHHRGHRVPRGRRDPVAHPQRRGVGAHPGGAGDRGHRRRQLRPGAGTPPGRRPACRTGSPTGAGADADLLGVREAARSPARSARPGRPRAPLRAGPRGRGDAVTGIPRSVDPATGEEIASHPAFTPPSSRRWPRPPGPAGLAGVSFDERARCCGRRPGCWRSGGTGTRPSSPGRWASRSPRPAPRSTNAP